MSINGQNKKSPDTRRTIHSEGSKFKERKKWKREFKSDYGRENIQTSTTIRLSDRF